MAFVFQGARPPFGQKSSPVFYGNPTPPHPLSQWFEMIRSTCAQASLISVLHDSGPVVTREDVSLLRDSKWQKIPGPRSWVQSQSPELDEKGTKT